MSTAIVSAEHINVILEAATRDADEEGFEWFAQGKWWTGSSPLMRGKRGATRHEHGLQGLIPAHAGKTLPRGRWRSWRPAHPR